jgi:hypothetical protein
MPMLEASLKDEYSKENYFGPTANMPKKMKIQNKRKSEIREPKNVGMPTTSLQ